MTLISVPRLSKAAFAAAFFLLSCQPPAVQKPSPVTPKTAFNNIPTLNLSPQKYPMPSAIKQKVLAKGLNPDSMTVVPRKELKTLAEQWKQRQAPPALNPPFAIQQLIPPTEDQVSCDWDTMNVCGYENVGNWDEYYDAMYNSDYQEELCVYERKEYCAYSEDQSCHISYTEMQFQGCDCPEGYEKSEDICNKVLYLKVYDENNQTEFNPSIPVQIQSYNRAGFSIFAEASWTLTVQNNTQEIVFEESGYGDRYLSWEMLDSSDSKLPVGVYTAILTEGEQQKRVSIEIENQLVLKISHFDRTKPVTSEPILMRPPVEGEGIEIQVQPAQDSLIEIIDPLGSVVWYKKGSVFKSWWIWEGMDQEEQLLYSGDYTVRLSANGVTKEEKIRLQVPESVSNQEVELYHDRSVVDLLDSVEKRLDVMKRDTELLILDTQDKFPNAPGFQVTAFRPAQDFRIQQQVEDPPLPEDFNYISQSDVPKSWLDTRNDRIVDEVEILRQKVAWVENVYQSFQTQSTANTALPDEVNDLKQSFYGIDTTGGCYDYYNIKAKWKRKKRIHEECPEREIKLFSAVTQGNRSILLRGRTNYSPPDCLTEAVDIQSLVPDFSGYLKVNDFTVTGTHEAFEINITDFDHTEKYVEEFSMAEPDFAVPVKITECTQGCIESESLNLQEKYDYEVELETFVGPMVVTDPFGVTNSNNNGSYYTKLGAFNFSFGPNPNKRKLPLDGVARFKYHNIVNGKRVPLPILEIKEGRYTASVRNAAGKVVWLERFKYPLDDLTFIPTHFSSGEFSALLRPNHEVLWDGRDNASNRVPNGTYSFWIHGMIRLMDGTPLIADPKQKEVIKNVDFFNIFHCPTTSRKRYLEDKLLNGGKHSPTWKREDIKSLAIKENIPEGQFGNEIELQAVLIAYAPFVCPGTSEFFETEHLTQSKVFHPAIPDFMNHPLPATHVFVKVQNKRNAEGAYEVHAYPALKPRNK